ncbi:WhiB family transcriptional regulator [Streptomyces sp. Ru87]|uniref:WhiB family transcriptional regulator n=1 Tax=Streptomyces sp. Ru87 TaxID=2044307 RepID=UPI000BF3862E|nr:WhiB family transcriptional regulator [Streptomyces sp. Ru87]PGH49697.1 transcription factor WhiB [Streptomyces sp. Ru87]
MGNTETSHVPPETHPRALGDHTWHDHAACRSTPHHQVDPELFFPDPDELDRIRAAKSLCAQCPVRRTCLDAALEAGDRDGIRGGMTEEEREPLHSNLEHRLDYTRVNEVLAGRDIHLTKAERRAVVRAAYQAGTSTERLAWLLKVTEEHAEKLYRRTSREIRNRAAEQEKPRWKNPDADRPDRDDLGTAA